MSLILQLLDAEAYADVRSIREAMERREAPFYLRRTKEAMLSFPAPQPDGTWIAQKLFTKRIPHTVPFNLEGEELELYQAVTNYVKAQSLLAAQQNDDRRARAVGFLMAMYQRRMASSIFALKESLRRRQKKLKEQLESADVVTGGCPSTGPRPPKFPHSYECGSIEAAVQGSVFPEEQEVSTFI